MIQEFGFTNFSVLINSTLILLLSPKSQKSPTSPCPTLASLVQLTCPESEGGGRLALKYGSYFGLRHSITLLGSHSKGVLISHVPYVSSEVLSFFHLEEDNKVE